MFKTILWLKFSKGSKNEKVSSSLQESKASHKYFLSTKAFLARTYLKDISQKFPKENFKRILKKRKQYVCTEMLLKTKEMFSKCKKKEKS